MKKMVSVIVSVLVIAGCNNTGNFNKSVDVAGNNSSNANLTEALWERDGISFRYPGELVASYGDTGSIQVFKPITFSDYANKCGIDAYEDFELWEAMDERVQSILNGLKELKIEGVTNDNMSDILVIDNDGCGWTAGNVRAEPIKVSGLNGAILERCECQDSGELNSLYTTLIFVNQYDEVYEIRFRYNFGDFESGLPESFVSDNEWESVYNFFLEGTPIEIKWLQGFMENREVIDKVINSVEIVR